MRRHQTRQAAFLNSFYLRFDYSKSYARLNFEQILLYTWIILSSWIFYSQTWFLALQSNLFTWILANFKTLLSHFTQHAMARSRQAFVVTIKTKNKKINFLSELWEEKIFQRHTHEAYQFHLHNALDAQRFESLEVSKSLKKALESFLLNDWYFQKFLIFKLLSRIGLNLYRLIKTGKS